MTWPVHLSTGIILSKFIPYPLNVIAAFLSHILIDKVNEKKVNWEEEVIHYLPWVLWWALAFIVLWDLNSPIARLCMIAAILPDLIEIIYIAIKGIKVWEEGKLLFWWHRKREVKELTWGATITIEVVAFLIALIIKGGG